MSDLRLDLEFNADTSKAKKQIEDLVGSLKKITSTPSSVFDDEELKQGVKAAKELESHLVKALNVKTGNLDLSKFSKSLSGAGKDLTYFQKNLSKIGVDGERAFLNLAKSISRAQTPTVKLNNKLADLMQSLKNTAKWEFSSNILHGLEGAIQHAYGYAKELDTSLNNIRIVTGQNADQMARFAVEANRAAKALSTTTTEYTDASLIYYQQGLSDKQVKERTDITVKMANVTGQSAQVVSDQMTSIWNNFDDGSKKLEYYADVLNKLGADTASSTDEIAEGMQKFSAVADTVGLSFEYASSALATITATTRESASVVGTALKSLFSRFQSLKLGDTLEDGTDLRKYSEALATVGVNIKDHNGQLKDMDTLLTETAAAWETLGKNEKIALAQTVGGIRQYNQMIALMDNWDFMEKNLQTAFNSTGALDKQAKTFEQGWQASINRVKAAAEGIYDNLINEDFFISFNDNFAKALESVNGLVSGLGGMKGILLSAGGILSKYFAKEMPDSISNIVQNIKTISGKSQNDLTSMQRDNISKLESFNVAKGTENSNEFQAEKQALIEVSKLKNKLTQNSFKLTKAEKEEAQAVIDQTQARYDQVIKLGRQADANEKNKNRTIGASEDALKNTYDLARVQLNELNEKSDFLEEKISKLRGQAETLDGDAAKKENDKAILKAEEELKKINERIDNNLVNGLGTEEISKLLSAKKKEIKKAVTDLTKNWKEIANIEKAMSSTRAQNKYLKGKSAKDIDESDLKKLKNYLKGLQEIEDVRKNIASSPDLQKTFDNLLIKIDSKDVKKVKELFDTFTTGLAEINEGENSRYLDSVDKKISDIKDHLREVFKDVPDSENIIAKLSLDAEQAADSTLTLEEVLKNLQKNNSMPGFTDHTVKASEAIMDLSSSVMELYGLVESTKEAFDILFDEEATGFEKVGAVVGLLTTGLTTVVSLTDTLNNLSNIQKQASSTSEAIENVGETAGEVGVEIAAEVIASDHEVEEATTSLLNRLRQRIIGFITALRGLITSHPIAATIIALGAVTVGAIVSQYEQAREKAEELAIENNNLANSLRDENTTRTNDIKEMGELLQVYKETGEQKDRLDALTQELCKTYDVEGSNLAALSGNYKNYEKVLDGIIKKRKDDLEELKTTEEEAAKSAGEQAVFDARDGAGHKTFSGGYQLDFNPFIEEYGKENANDIVASKILQNALSNNLVDGASYSINEKSKAAFSVSLDDISKTEQLYSLYQGLLEAKENMEKAASNGKLDLDDSREYQQTVDWLNKMSESLELYGQHAKEAIKINEALETSFIFNGEEISVLDLDEPDDYNAYLEWVKQVEKEIEEAGYKGQEAKEILEEIINMSPNPNLTAFKKINDILNEIRQTGFEVEGILEGIISESVFGKGEFDLDVLTGLNWGHLDAESWYEAAEAAQLYKISATEALEAQSRRDAADSALSYYDSPSGPTDKEYEKIAESFDWGNAEAGLIEFTDFMKLETEQQFYYFEALASAGSQAIIATHKGALLGLQTQYDQEMAWYTEKTQELSENGFGSPEEYLEKLNAGKDQILSIYDEVAEGKRRIQDLSKDELQLFADMLNGMPLGEGTFDTTKIAELFEKDREELESYIESSKIIVNAEDLVEYETEGGIFDQIQQQIDDEQRAIEIEYRLHPEDNIDIIYDEIDKIISEITEEKDNTLVIDADLDDTELALKLNQLLEREYYLDIGVSKYLDKELANVEREIGSIVDTASKIDDNFLVKPEDIEAVAAQFEGILEGYTVTANGMIQLNEDVAVSTIGTAKSEAESSVNAVKAKLQAEKVYHENKKAIYEDIVAQAQKVVDKDADAAEARTQIQKDITKLNDLEEQRRLDLQADAQKAKIENIGAVLTEDEKANTAMNEEAEKSFQSYAKMSQQAAQAAINNAVAIARAFAAAADGDVDGAMGAARDLGRNGGGSISSSYVAGNNTVDDSNIKNGDDVTPSKRGEGEDDLPDITETEAYQQLIDTTNASIAMEDKIISHIEADLAKLDGVWQGAEHTLGNIASGLGADGKSPGGSNKKDGKSDKDKKKKEKKLISQKTGSEVDLLDLREEIDQYATVEQYLQKITIALEDAARASDKLYGVKKLEAISEEINLLKELTVVLQKQKNIAERARDTDKKIIESLGFIIDEDGVISNLDDKLIKLGTIAYNAQVQYNEVVKANPPHSDELKEWDEKHPEPEEGSTEGLSEEDAAAVKAQFEEDHAAWDSARRAKVEETNLKIAAGNEALKIAETEKDTAEKNFEYAQKMTDRYQEDIQKIIDLTDQIEDSMDKILEKNYQDIIIKLNYEIEINEDQLDRINLKLKIMDGNFSYLSESLIEMQSQEKYLINNLEQNEQAFDKLNEALEKGEITQANYIEGIQQTQNSLLRNIEALVDLDKQMRHFYEDTLNEATGKFEKFANKFDIFQNTLEHFKNVMDLLGQSQDYEKINKVLNTQMQVEQGQLNSQRKFLQTLKNQREGFLKQVNDLSLRPEDRKIAQENLDLINNQIAEAQSQINESVEQIGTFAQEILMNSLEQANKNFENKLVEGLNKYRDPKDQLYSLEQYLDKINYADRAQEEYLTKTNQIYETNVLMRQAQLELEKTSSSIAKKKYQNFIKETEALQEQGKLSKFELEIAKSRYEVLQAQIALEEAKENKDSMRLVRNSSGNWDYVFTADATKTDKAQQELDKAQNNLYNKGLEGAKEYQSKYAQIMQEALDKFKEIEEAYANGEITAQERDQRLSDAKAFYYEQLKTYSDLYYTGHNLLVEESYDNEADYLFEGIGDLESFKDGTEEYLEDCNSAFDEWGSNTKDLMDEVGDSSDDLDEKLNKLTQDSGILSGQIQNHLIPELENELIAVQELTLGWIAHREELERTIQTYIELYETMQNNKAEEIHNDKALSGFYDPNVDYSEIMNSIIGLGIADKDSDLIRALNAQREAKIDALGLTEKEYGSRGSVFISDLTGEVSSKYADNETFLHDTLREKLGLMADYRGDIDYSGLMAEYIKRAGLEYVDKDFLEFLNKTRDAKIEEELLKNPNYNYGGLKGEEFLNYLLDPEKQGYKNYTYQGNDFWKDLQRTGQYIKGIDYSKIIGSILAYGSEEDNAQLLDFLASQRQNKIIREHLTQDQYKDQGDSYRENINASKNPFTLEELTALLTSLGLTGIFNKSTPIETPQEDNKSSQEDNKPSTEDNKTPQGNNNTDSFVPNDAILIGPNGDTFSPNPSQDFSKELYLRGEENGKFVYYWNLPDDGSLFPGLTYSNDKLRFNGEEVKKDFILNAVNIDPMQIIEYLEKVFAEVRKPFDDLEFNKNYNDLFDRLRADLNRQRGLDVPSYIHHGYGVLYDQNPEEKAPPDQANKDWLSGMLQSWQTGSSSSSNLKNSAPPLDSPGNIGSNVLNNTEKIYQQTVNISADFPNVSQASEIYNAILELANDAAQKRDTFEE